MMLNEKICLSACPSAQLFMLSKNRRKPANCRRLVWFSEMTIIPTPVGMMFRLAAGTADWGDCYEG
jgi:hypothetical protein